MILALIDDAARWSLRLIHRGGKGRSYSTRLAASASMFSVSRAFVGSSNARIPQFWPNESERARRIMMDANIFCPAEQRPRMSISAWSFVMTTWASRWAKYKFSDKVTNSLDNCMIVLKHHLQHPNEFWYHLYLKPNLYWRYCGDDEFGHTSSLIGFVPQVPHCVVNFFHFQTMILHDSAGMNDVSFPKEDRKAGTLTYPRLWRIFPDRRSPYRTSAVSGIQPDHRT